MAGQDTHRVVEGIGRVQAGDVPHLHLVCPAQDALGRPFGQLARVVLKFGREHCPALLVHLLAPINASGELAVPLVERVYVVVSSLGAAGVGDEVR